MSVKPSTPKPASAAMPATPSTPAMAAPPGSLGFSENSFTWNGIESVIPSVVDLEALFGKPDRVMAGANQLSTWDSLGLVAYIEPRSKQLISLAVIFRHDKKYAFTPAAVFTGEMVTPWGVIRASSTSQELAAMGFKSDVRKGPTTSFYATFKPAGLIEVQLCRNE